MSKREKIIGITMAVMIAIAAFLYLSDSKSKGKVTSKSKGKTASNLKKSKAVTSSKKGEAEAGDSWSLKEIADQISMRNQEEELDLIRDPFEALKPNITELSFSDLILSGVHWEDEKPVAIINNQILNKGDEISGFLVDEIRFDEVILIKDKRWHILKFTK